VLAMPRRPEGASGPQIAEAMIWLSFGMEKDPSGGVIGVQKGPHSQRGPFCVPIDRQRHGHGLDYSPYARGVASAAGSGRRAGQ